MDSRSRVSLCSIRKGGSLRGASCCEDDEDEDDDEEDLQFLTFGPFRSRTTSGSRLGHFWNTFVSPL
eukprot:2979890-Heterocapsa_arctica.AAC.1